VFQLHVLDEPIRERLHEQRTDARLRTKHSVHHVDVRQLDTALPSPRAPPPRRSKSAAITPTESSNAFLEETLGSWQAAREHYRERDRQVCDSLRVPLGVTTSGESARAPRRHQHLPAHRAHDGRRAVAQSARLCRGRGGIFPFHVESTCHPHRVLQTSQAAAPFGASP
jgi:hypothetical protein